MKVLQKAHELDFGAQHQSSGTRASLSDENVLALQDYFLTTGLHIFRVPNAVVGRALIDVFINASGHRVGLLSTDYVPSAYFNVYHDLLMHDALTKDGGLEDYILTSVSWDVLVIEGTPELFQSSWYGQFEQLLIDYEIITKIPVFVLLR
jgi:hypothetical protein